MSDDRHGTRARIQEVALGLFAEQGYDKTSLREIAERLGVTKAALYYHFRSKEDIVHSLFEDYADEIDKLIAWGRLCPRTARTRRELLDRYLDIVVRRTEVFRCLERNQAAMRNLGSGDTRDSKELFRERVRSLADLTQDPDAPLAQRVRMTLAFTALHVGWLFFQDEPAGREELRAVVLGIACDLAMVPRAAAVSP
jgi:AcrR family transcriptional regulator